MATSDYTSTKTCSKCGETYPVTPEYWHRNSRSRDGFRPDCKKCVSIRAKKHRAFTGYDKKRYWGNRESELARNKKYYARIKASKPLRVRKSPEEYAEYKQQWYYENVEACKERARLWYINHHERARSRSKEYRKNNKETIKAAKSAAKSLRRSRMINAEGVHTKQDILRLVRLQESRCAYCGITLFDDYQVDHIVPVSRCGSNSPDNLCIACGDCNNSKGNKTPKEWAEVRGW